MSNIKKINFNFDNDNTNDKKEKEVKKRIITENQIWKKYENKLSIEDQYAYITELHKGDIENAEICDIIFKQIKQKLSGYRNQDTIKKILDMDKLINVKQILNLLYDSELDCYYCKKKVRILYENVREPTQWSLDRIYNEHGHNNDNVVIACLSCNLHRKTMYHERFAFTKQLNIIKQS